MGEFLDLLNSNFRRTAPWLSLTEVRRLTNCGAGVASEAQGLFTQRFVVGLIM